MMKKLALGLLTFSVLTAGGVSAAKADSPSYTNADLVGTWAGSGTGTFSGINFATNFVITADRHGHVSIAIISTIDQPNTNVCTLNVQPNGLGTGTCTSGSSSVDPGATTVIGFVLTNRELRFYQTQPGTDLLTTGIAIRQ